MIDVDRGTIVDPDAIHPPSNISMGRYTWNVTEDDIVRSGKMYFFYLHRNGGFWSEGFASRYVNISRPVGKDVAVEKVSDAGPRGVQSSFSLAFGMASLVSLVVVVCF